MRLKDESDLTVTGLEYLFTDGTTGVKRFLINSLQSWFGLETLVRTEAEFVAALSSSATSTIKVIAAFALTANRTVTRPLWIMPGCAITTTGRVLAINGPFLSGIYQVFSGSGTVSFAKGSVPAVIPQWFGAVGNGTTSDTTALSQAIVSLPSIGGTIFGPPGSVYKLTTGITTGAKMVRFLGADWSAGFTGSGITLITLAAPMSSVENWTISDPTGNASTIAVNIDNSGSSMYYPVISRNRFAGTGKLGTAIKMTFALDGDISKNAVENWGKGLDYNASSANRCNANDVHGNTFYECHYSINFGANSINEAWIHHNTLEGASNYGIYAAVSAGGTIYATENHFECTGETGILATSTDLVSRGNTFSGHAAYQDIVTNSSGNNSKISYNDSLASGVQNWGTDPLEIYEPHSVPVYTGTGVTDIYKSDVRYGTYADLTAWTPTLCFGGHEITSGAYGGAYSAQVGYYQVSGKMVTCFMRIVLTNKGTATGAATITGLPFTSRNDVSAGMGTINYSVNMASLSTTPFLGVQAISKVASIYQGGAGGASGLTDTNFQNTTGIGCIFTYLLP